MWVLIVAFLVLCFNILRVFSLNVLTSTKKSKFQLGEKGRARVVAHRGSRCEGKIVSADMIENDAGFDKFLCALIGLPENTVSAFKDAVKAGADVIEFDVWLSRDGKVVVHHDKNFCRMCGDNFMQNIYETDYSDFPPIIPPEGQSDRCHLFPADECYSIPLLETVLQSIPANVAINIEFKQDSEKLARDVRELIRKYNRKDNVFWFSLDEKINKKLRQEDPSLPTITSIPTVLKVLVFYYIGALPFIDMDDAVYGTTLEEITLEKVRHESALKGMPDLVKRLLAWLFQGRPPYVMLAPRLYAHLKKRGIPIWFLGVNDIEDLQLAIRSGATAVLTDRVNWLCAQLKDKRFVFDSIQQ